MGLYEYDGLAVRRRRGPTDCKPVVQEFAGKLPTGDRRSGRCRDWSMWSQILKPERASSLLRSNLDLLGGQFNSGFAFFSP